MVETQTQKTVVKPSIFISTDTLFGMLQNVKGATFAQIHTTTEPAMRVGNNPFIEKVEGKNRNLVVKESCSNVMLGFNYENVVNNTRVRDAVAEAAEVGVDKDTLSALMGVFNTSVEEFTPNFEPKPHKWADHCTHPDGSVSRILVEKRSDTSCKYVQVWILNTQEPTYRYKDGYKDGRVLTPYELEAMKSFLSKKSSNAGHQGVKQEVIIRDYSIGNIKQINMNKAEYYIS